MAGLTVGSAAPPRGMPPGGTAALCGLPAGGPAAAGAPGGRVPRPVGGLGRSAGATPGRGWNGLGCKGCRSRGSDGAPAWPRTGWLSRRGSPGTLRGAAGADCGCPPPAPSGGRRPGRSMVPPGSRSRPACDAARSAPLADGGVKTPFPAEGTGPERALNRGSRRSELGGRGSKRRVSGSGRVGCAGCSPSLASRGANWLPSLGSMRGSPCPPRAASAFRPRRSRQLGLSRRVASFLLSLSSIRDVRRHISITGLTPMIRKPFCRTYLIARSIASRAYVALAF